MNFKSIKRYISLLLVLSVFLSSIYYVSSVRVNAADSVPKVAVYLNENFNSFTDTPPQDWKVYGSNADASVTGETCGGADGKVAKLHIKDNDALNLNFTYTFPSSRRPTGKILFEVRAMTEKNDFFSPLIQVRSTKDVKATLISFTKEGSIQFLDKVIKPYEANTWYRLSVVFDTLTGNCEFYIDGVNVGSSLYANFANVDIVAGLTTYIKGQSGKECSLNIDYVRAYTSDKPLDNVGETGSGMDSGSGGDGSESGGSLNGLEDKMKEAMKQAVALYKDSEKAFVNSQKVDINSKDASISPYIKDDVLYVPAKFVCENTNFKYQWNQNVATIKSAEKLNITVKNPLGQIIHKAFSLVETSKSKIIKITPNQNFAEVDGKKITLTRPALFDGKELYITEEIIKNVLGKKVLYDYRGLIIISDKEEIFAPAEKELLSDEVLKALIYERPTASQIIKDLEAKNPSNSHPRLFLNSQSVTSLKQRVTTDPLAIQWYADIRKAADSVLAKPVGVYELYDGRRMQAARDARPYIEQTALMYLLSGEQKYLDRAVAELEAVIAFKDWNHQNEFLNTAEMTAGVAIGYDWLYPYLSEDLKLRIRTAIKANGLLRAMEAYDSKAWWSQPRELINNWNAVCNGGIAMGAMAIGDEDKDISGKVLEKALRSLEDGIIMKFSPDGGWGEGPGYWRYTIEYIVSFMATMQSAIGKDYGHSRTPGLMETAYYPAYITGPQGTFNYADASSGKMKIPEMFWLSKALNNPSISAQRVSMMLDAKQAGGIYDLIWYDPAFVSSTTTLSKDKYFRDSEVVTLRGNWDDVYSTFAGFKSGKGYMSHGHMDVGNFIFQANGEQWAIDLGPDSYNLKDYFGYGARRFKYYRTKPEGHNTLVFNTTDEFQQDQYAFSKIENFVSKPKGGFAITDMTPSYAKNASSIKRGVMLGKNRSYMVVQDELQTLKPSELWWFMHTKATIQVNADGKSAVLTQNGKKLWVQLISPDPNLNAKFTVMEADPYLQPSPVTASEGVKEDTNDGIRKLAIKFTNATNLNYAVALIPLKAGQSVPDSIPEYTSLSNWSIEDGEIDIPQADEITIDGNIIPGFKKEIETYNLSLPFGTTTAPQVSAKCSDKYSLEVIQATGLFDKTLVKVTSKANPKEVTVYTISYAVLPSLNPIDGLQKINILKEWVSCSSEQVDATKKNYATNTVDGNLATMWAAEGNQWIQYDLQEAKKIKGIGIGFSKGNERRYTFEVEVSQDGQTWEKVLIGASSMVSLNVEYFSLPEKTVRFIRVNGKGNTTNTWNSYLEVEVLEAK